MEQQMDLDIVGQLLDSPEVGQPLYHYTSPDGLLGILETQKLWCTQIFYLNDYQENLTVWKYFFKGLKSWSNPDEEAAGFIRTLEMSLSPYDIFNVEQFSFDVFNKFKINDYDLFVFSFSQTEDDLSQWRGYTHHSHGYSVELNVNNLLSIQSVFEDGVKSNRPNSGILIKNCVYEEAKKEEIINRLLDHSFQRFKNFRSQWKNEIFFNLLSLNIFFKNEKFSGEKECRIAILPYAHLRSTYKFRKGASYLVPYIELDLPLSHIRSITAGPSPFPHHSLAALTMLQEQQKPYLNHVALKVSNIPFRNW